MFSENDISYAEYYKVTEYMVAPAGHILKYVPGSVRCRGGSFIQQNYQFFVRPPSAARGQPAFRPDEWVQRPLGQAKPKFCPAG